MVAWSFRNIGRVNTESGSPADPPTMTQRMEMTKRLLRNPVLWGLTFVRGLRGMALVSLVIVIPLYLGNELDVGPWWRGFHMSLLIVVGLVAKTGAGYLSDRWGRKQVLVPGLLWSCLVALGMVIFDDGIALTIAIALMGLFLYPDQPILTAAVFDVVGREVASTGLGVVACVAFLMSAGSALIVGAIFETMGFTETMYYIAGLFALAAVVFGPAALVERHSSGRVNLRSQGPVRFLARWVVVPSPRYREWKAGMLTRGLSRGQCYGEHNCRGAIRQQNYVVDESTSFGISADFRGEYPAHPVLVLCQLLVRGGIHAAGVGKADGPGTGNQDGGVLPKRVHHSIEPCHRCEAA